MGNYSLLNWDSRFFGYKIATVNHPDLELEQLKDIIKELEANDFKLAYCFVSPEDTVSNYSLKTLEGFLADEKITYTIQTGKDNMLPVSDNIMPYDSSTASEKLVSLTLQSGLYSRFRIDPKFVNNEFERLYTVWIEKSVSKQLANEVIVYKEDGEIYGFVTLVVHEKTGSIGLIAVDEKQRGKAIGKKLIGSALSYFRDHNIINVDVVTQKSNFIACRFYESCGFEIKDTINIYHLWMK
jgi:dTDP-4-amino-4,6-dideoxy-D-galactose acyltransferase